MKKAGILLHILELKNKYGCGTLGDEAYDFVDFLSVAKQDYWQVLPIGQTSYKDSPYQSFSSFAGNPYFINLEYLLKDNLITRIDLENSNLENDTNYIDYGSLFNNKLPLLKKAYLKHELFEDEFNCFKKENSWINDYALFMALKEKNNNKCWLEWDNQYKFRNKKALDSFTSENKDLIESYKFIQYLFKKQWTRLKVYANLKGIKIIGDIPIYVSLDSVDVWVNPELFKLDENLNPTVVAGVPPDYFSSTGQLWGNPIYNYEEMKKDNYSWWVNRVKLQFKYFDVLRIDHFRGFEAYYEIPFNSIDAINGKWQKGPGIELFNIINTKLNNPSIIAENLGLLDDDVYNLIDSLGYPGMRILEFEMYSKDNLESLSKINPNNFIYPGTHDNDTFKGWYKSLDINSIERKLIDEGFKEFENEEFNIALINYAYLFNVDTIIISMQDILGLDSKARINTPGTDTNNWQFMFNTYSFTNSLAKKIALIKEKNIKQANN